MYKTSTELIQNELPPNLLKPIYTVFQNANVMFKEIMGLDYFNSKYLLNIKGRMLNFVICSLFQPKYLSSNFPFEVEVKDLKFQKSVVLKRNNILLTIGKTCSKGTLPNTANYKEEYAAGNWGISNQLFIDWVYEDIIIKQQPYYGIITYGMKENNFDYIDLIIPDYKFQSILDSIEIKPKFELLHFEPEDDDDSILSNENLKKELQEELQNEILKDKGVNNE